MFSFKVAVTLKLQAASFFSGGAAKCLRKCRADDPLLVLFRSEEVRPKALAFCSDYLGLPVSTVEVTVTPTV